MKNFGIFVNPQIISQEKIFDLLKEFHVKEEVNFYRFVQQKDFVPDYFLDTDLASSQHLDYILVFGGDGTILRAIDFSIKSKAPLLGINLGKLGFLSESNLKDLKRSISDLCAGKFKIQSRMLLQVSIKRGSEIIYSSVVLNDAVIYRGEVSRLIDIRYSCNQRFVMETRCDGIIIATPTGSTAYNLSAGGPIISPLMDAMVVTPLNPHVLTVRPIVFAARDKLSFRVVQTEGSSILHLDGKNSHNLEKNDEIIIKSASQKVDFIKLSNKTFFSILRKKFHLGKK
ncbi:MAG: NAD(+)/NADH kinase [Candidatus Cloacimonadales bacterium]